MAKLSTEQPLKQRRMSAMPTVHNREQSQESRKLRKSQKPINVTTEIDDETIDAYVDWWIEWNDHRYRDEELCETFCEDFGEWTEQHWKACSPEIRRNLQDMLRRNGVFIPKRNIKADIALKQLATSKNYFPEWTTQEIMHQYKHHGKIDTRNPLILEDQEYCKQLWEHGEEIYWKGTRDRVEREEEIEFEEQIKLNDKEKSRVKEADDMRESIRDEKYGTNPKWQYRKPDQDITHRDIEFIKEKFEYPQQDHEEQLQKHHPPTPRGFAKQLTDLEKLYIDKDSKYSGQLYDILSTKLLIFYDFCGKVGLDKAQYHNAYSSMLKDRARQFYYDHLATKNYEFQKMIDLTKTHFETEANKQEYLTLWRLTTLQKVKLDNPEKKTSECFQIMIDTLQRIQRGLWGSYQVDQNIRDQVLNGCQGIKECEMALFNPEKSFEAVIAQIRNAIHTREQQSQNLNQFLMDPDYQDDSSFDQNYVERKYAGGGRFRQNHANKGGSFRENDRNIVREGNPAYSSYRSRFGSNKHQKKCFICGKPGCWSTSHSQTEQKQGFSKFQGQAYANNKPNSRAYYNQFLTAWEGNENGIPEKENEEVGQFLIEWEPEEYFDENIDDKCNDQFLTEFGPIDPFETIQYLNNQSTLHAVSRKDIFLPRRQYNYIEEPFDSAKSMRKIENSIVPRYSDVQFQGIIPDTGAAGVSTAGYQQVIALQRQDTSIQVDRTRAGEHKIRFGKGDAISLGTIDVNTPIGIITFHVIPLSTPFLLCIQDMKRMKVKLDNLKNVLIQGERIVPIVMKFGHPWMLLDQEQSIVYCHLTETELRQLHRRFGHPSVKKLVDLLERAGHDVRKHIVQKLTRSCHQCQIHGKSPGRFKFKLPEIYCFNHIIIADVVNLEGDNALHIVDEATNYQAGRFLTDMSATAVWNALRACWIDVYLGPPDFISHDAGTNLASREFRQNANSMGIQVSEVPVEAHNSIGKVERYHTPLRRVYKIICSELREHNIPKDMKLQMALKALNDSIGPNGLVPTLLVYGAYPRITKDSQLSPSIAKRAQAIEKGMKELQKLRAERRIKDALATRNGPNTLPVLDLPLNSEVLVWRENKGWKGPFKLLAMDTNHQECVIDMPYGPTKFRSTVVKPYYRNIENDTLDTSELDTDNNSPDELPEQPDNDYNHEQELIHDIKRGRGRPKGSLNRPKPNFEPLIVERKDVNHNDVYYVGIDETKGFNVCNHEMFLSAKEKSDYELSLKLRKDGVITTPGKPFELSTRIEFDSLIENVVVKLETYDISKHGEVRIFNSRLIHEIKGKETSKPYEKTRMVIAAWGDDGKADILTQSPTLQRASQRLLVAIAPSLLKFKDKKFGIWLRDISQAYTQSNSVLSRSIYAKLPKTLKNWYSDDTIMVIVKPLYGIPEAGTHWWATYMNHHFEKLQMRSSTFDPCLLITKGDIFGLVGMQTDDTLIIGEEKFSEKENSELTFIAKPKETLTCSNPLFFNGCILKLNNDKTINLQQKGQAKKIKLIESITRNNITTYPNTVPKTKLISEEDVEKTLHNYDDLKRSYVQQRARGAYVASICQPEASFDLSIAAQVQQPTEIDIKKLNERLNWQMKNIDRGLIFIPLNLATAKIFVFVDGSFANNQDLSSQIGYIIVLANEKTSKNFKFCIEGNIVHYSSIKSKRVTRSVLASEIYGMVEGVDMAYALSSTLKIITDQLNIPEIQTVLCTDSYSLYECLVKLGTTKEKRLMIDIMALRQSYERRELYEIRWINGHDNPADAMTKGNPNKALETLITKNELSVRVEGWVKRD